MQFVPMNSPPLPLGWTEHTGPGGQPYYYNAQTQESTYVRPIPAFPIMPTGQSETTKKKEKPQSKTPIPGTDWIRVKTTGGNVFYFHKTKKESTWAVPEEIKSALETLERGESGKGVPTRTAEEAKRDREQSLEIERVKGEVQELVKRKAENQVPIEEVVVLKKTKFEEPKDEESDSSEEEEWQQEAAAQLAAEAEAEKMRREEEAERGRIEAEAEAKRAQAAQINMPDRVDLSLEEAKALFKTLLREKDINPLHPWDNSLPKFISDPRYVLLPSVSARREAFDEYCRDRARELRQSVIRKEQDAANPKEEYDRLLKEDVQSTRSSWTDFRRKWKKDRRFYGWGRDDREREKRFRDYVKELGEKKRALAQKAEVDFFALLREHQIRDGTVWKEVKQTLYDDPRYDAIGSSSLREELYTTFLKGSHTTPQAKIAQLQDNLSKDHSRDGEKGIELDEEENQRSRRMKKERAVKEREERVKAELGRLEVDIGRSRQGIYKEEGEREFMSLLTDAVRDPQMTWDTILPQLKSDPRFRNSPLPFNQQLHLFHAHIAHLRSKHIHGLHGLFESHAPSLANTFDDLPLPSLLESIPITKLGYNIADLEHEFVKWQRERSNSSKKAFDEMMSENSFVEFWGRLNKIGGEGVDGGVKADETEGDEGEGGGGKVDMKALAKSVDVGEVEKVLKNDKRYIVFDHVPDQRERWIRDYLSNLSAPKLSVHAPQYPA